MAGLKEAEHLRISLKDIELATNNFETCIGKGGYGLVYKGELSISDKVTTVAVKRLNKQFGQGLKEFLTEIQLLTGQKHPNLISLLGYCDEEEEKIIVYEYAERGSLDRYLMSTTTNYTLTWLERLRICVDVARGLDHLHNHVGKHQAIIHRDIKSSNILVDQNWVAKISDLGLSKLSFAGLGRSAVISRACGTPGYCEPEYIITGIVKKESDVYSFGMVLFEVLCGRLCSVRHQDGLFLSAPLAKHYHRKKKMVELIDPGLKEQMSFESMNKFSTIAYRCVQSDRGHRPTMDLVVKELAESLEIQIEYESAKAESSTVVEVEYAKPESLRLVEFDSEGYWERKLPQDSEDILKRLNPGAIYTSKKELFSLLHKGILFDNKERFFWINDAGTKCVSISSTRFLETMKPTWVTQHDTRFSRVAEFPYTNFHEIRCQIKTSMLSLSTMYAASLVFKWQGGPEKDLRSTRLMAIKWKLEDLCVYSTHAAELTQDNWYKIEMWHFINHVSNVEFDIVIDHLSYLEDPKVLKSNLLIQGFEFKPVDMIEGFESPLTTKEEDIDYWEKNLPKEHQHYINQMSDKPLSYTSKKELYHLLCAGFLAYKGALWFSICKSTGGICSMLPTSELYIHDKSIIETLRLPGSRFSEVKKLKDTIHSQTFTCILRSSMFSPKHIYACYLVFKFTEKNICLDNTRLLEVNCTMDGHCVSYKHVHLNYPHRKNIPILYLKKDYGSHELSNVPRIEGHWMSKDFLYRAIDDLMEQRNDGWMEIIMCGSLQKLEDHRHMKVTLESASGSFYGIIVEGIEFRPMR